MLSNTMEQDRDSRDVAIDCIKGCLVLLVLVSHIDTRPIHPSISYLNVNFLMPWKMGLFFVITGMLYSNNANFGDFARWKFNRIVRPTIILAAIMIALVPNSTESSFSLFLTQYTFGVLKTAFVPAWFTMTLFTTLIVFHAISILSKNKISLFVLYCLLFSYFAYEHSPRNFLNGDSWEYVGFVDGIATLPFRISTLYITLPMVLSGYLYKVTNIYSNNTFCLFSSIIFLSILLLANINVDINNHQYTNYAQLLICSITSLPLMYKVGTTLSKFNIIKTILNTISRHAIFILILHIVSFNIMRDILKYSNFDISNSLSTTLMLIAGIIIPLFFAYIVKSSHALRSILFGDVNKNSSKILQENQF